MVFLCGMCFALRSGQEHRNLQFSQIELVEPQDSDSTPYLVYYENISKNNTGGIAQRKRDPKLVKHHANTMVFLCGMCFALRSGQEHRNLQFSQIELVEPMRCICS